MEANTLFGMIIMDRKKARALCFINNISKNRLIDYLYLIDRFFEDSSKELNEQIKDARELDFTDPFYDERYESQLIHKRSSFEKTFRNFHFYSFLILCFSYFEIKLIKVCKDELEDRDLSTEPSEFRSNDFDNVFKGTLKIVDIRFETISKKWGEIKNIQKVRNVIVHSNGRVIGSISEEQVRKYIGKRDDITIERGRIILSKEFCLYVLNTVKLFLDNFIDQLINTSSSTSPSIM